MKKKVLLPPEPDVDTHRKDIRLRKTDKHYGAWMFAYGVLFGVLIGVLLFLLANSF